MNSEVSGQFGGVRMNLGEFGTSFEGFREAGAISGAVLRGLG